MRPDQIHPTEMEGYDDPDTAKYHWHGMRYLIAVILAGAILLVWVVAAYADEYHVRVVFCNTPQQIKELLLAQNGFVAEMVINNRDGPNSCGGVDALADALQDVESVEKGGRVYIITRLHLVGLFQGGMLFPTDITQYAARLLAGYGI